MEANIKSKQKKMEREIKFKEHIQNEALRKSKVAHWKELKDRIAPGQRPLYMDKLTRKQTRAIFKVRSRMLPVKANQPTNQTDIKCRLCNQKDETQQHIIEECPQIRKQIHGENTAKTYEKIFKDENIEELKNIANQIIRIEAELENNRNA